MTSPHTEINPSTPDFGIIIQARTGSSRLPNKILKPFYQDQTILDIIINRLKQNAFKLPVVLATSTNPADKVLEGVANRHGIGFYKGDEQNVLKRFIGAAEAFGFTYIMRVCSDNPFLHLGCIDQLISTFKKQPVDYLSFKNAEGVPVIKTHYGLFTEVVTLTTLKKVLELTKEAFFCEHVTNFIYANPQHFRIELLPVPEVLQNRNDIRLTVDTQEDFENLSLLYSECIQNDANFDLMKLIRWLDKHPEVLSRMKSSIEQNSK